MENEHINSAENPPNTDSLPAEKKPRSKLERILVWGLIGVLVLITGMEALAQRGYSKSLAKLEEAMEEPEEPLTLNKFESNLKSGLTLKMTGSKEGQSTILYKWPSLLRKYEIHFTVIPGEEQILATYSTNDGPAALIGLPNPEGEELDEALEGGPGMAPGGGEETPEEKTAGEETADDQTAEGGGKRRDQRNRPQRPE